MQGLDKIEISTFAVTVGGGGTGERPVCADRQLLILNFKKGYSKGPENPEFGVSIRGEKGELRVKETRK